MCVCDRKRERARAREGESVHLEADRRLAALIPPQHEQIRLAQTHLVSRVGVQVLVRGLDFGS